MTKGVELYVVPWDYDFTAEEFDGLFISNGPGNPQVRSCKLLETNFPELNGALLFAGVWHCNPPHQSDP